MHHRVSEEPRFTLKTPILVDAGVVNFVYAIRSEKAKARMTEELDSAELCCRSFRPLGRVFKNSVRFVAHPIER